MIALLTRSGQAANANLTPVISTCVRVSASPLEELACCTATRRWRDPSFPLHSEIRGAAPAQAGFGDGDSRKGANASASKDNKEKWRLGGSWQSKAQSSLLSTFSRAFVVVCFSGPVLDAASTPSFHGSFLLSLFSHSSN